MADGDTGEQALAQAQEAIALWLETAQEHGDPIPSPRGRKLMYACPPGTSAC